MLRPGQAVEGYVVEDVLGRGGSATVYRARDDAHGTVALKLLDDDHRGPAEIIRLAREFEFARQLSHPHVVTVYRHGEAWLTMQLVDGGTATQVGVIEPQDFTGDGRDKTADYSVSLSLDSGTHEVVLCFTQSGAQGRKPKEFCTAPITVVVACDTCAKEGPFGDIVGNPDLCNGGGPPHVPVHVSGDLGDSAALAIDGPNGYHLDATMDHAGDSCIYQFNWDTTGNGGAGTYSFTVTGANGTSLSFTADLKCR